VNATAGLMADSVVMVVGHAAGVTVQLPWDVAWLLGMLLLGGLGVVFLTAWSAWDAVLRRVGWR